MTSGITPSSGDDTNEQNDIINEAKTLSPGSYSSLICLDEDWFKIDFPTYSTVVVTVTFPVLGNNLDLAA